MSEQRTRSASGQLKGSILGNLFKDPTVREFKGNNGPYEIVDVPVMCTPYKGKDKEPDPYFTTCHVRGGLGKVAKNLKKGDQVFMEGYIRPRIWETRDGQSKQAIDIEVHSFEIIRRKPRDDNGAPQQAPQSQTPAPAPADDDDDIPF